MQYLLGMMMFLTALFLILLVLVQRGRGGGLAGAFGGAGGQSAFGTKAGDMFTKITIGTAAFWILIAALSVRLLNQPETSVIGDGSPMPPTVISPRVPDEGDADFDLDALKKAVEDSGAETGATAEPAGTSPASDDGAGSSTETPTTETPTTETPAADPAPGE